METVVAVFGYHPCPPAYSLRSRRLEVAGERENGRARGRQAYPCLYNWSGNQVFLNFHSKSLVPTLAIGDNQKWREPWE